MESLKYWNKNTFDVTGSKWQLSERKNKSYTTSGSDNSGKNIYTYNQLGFRGDTLPLKGKKLMTVGCSHTEGVGVNNDETWPFYLSRKLGYSHINFGYTGRSNDYIARCIHTYIDEINPDLVCIMYTYTSRREFYTNENLVEPFHQNPWGWFADKNNKKYFNAKLELSNSNEDFINWYKNHLLITYYLQCKKVPYVWNGIFLNNNYDDGFRFDGEYNVDFNKHASPQQNRKYADELYKEIRKRKL